MQQLVGGDAPLSAIYANGYGPNASSSGWRKPSPKMFLGAANALSLDLSRSMMIGYRLSDHQACNAAGMAIFFICSVAIAIMLAILVLNGFVSLMIFQQKLISQRGGR